MPATGAYCRRIGYFKSLLFCFGHCYDNLLLLLRPLNARTEFFRYKPNWGVCAVVFDKRRRIIFFDPRGIERKALCHFLEKIVLVFKLFIDVPAAEVIFVFDRSRRRGKYRTYLCLFADSCRGNRIFGL